MAKEFEKNTANGQVKSKVRTEMDYEGKKMKQENTFESDGWCDHEHMHRGFAGNMPFGNFPMHMHHMHAHHHFHMNQPEGAHREFGDGGFKGKLTKLAFVLGIFNSIRVDEQKDKGFALSLNLKDIPEDLKAAIQKKINVEAACEHHEHKGFMAEFHQLNNPDFELNLLINENYEVEKAKVTVKGTKNDESNNMHEMSFNAELNMII